MEGTASASASASAPADSDREVAELVTSLQARLEASGEWPRLLKTLRKGLQDSEWDKNLREYARDKAMEQDGAVGLSNLVQLVQPQAKATVPESLKDELAAAIRAFVEQNVEE